MVASTRRPLFFNPEAKTSVIPISSPGNAPLKFHRSLPGYQPTKLVSLDSVADEVGVKSVLVKFEGQRLGLPSFKILGASWGTINAVTQKLGISSQSDLETVKSALKATPTTLFAATDGNHGMAVAHMGNLLGIPTKIFVPVGLHASAVEAIEKEGGLVTQINASYDETVQEAFRACGKVNGVFVQDTAFPGYEETANWVVEGYSTLHLEIDEALAGVSPDLVVAPVGVGSFAHSVVNHHKAEGRDTKVLTVEPDTAACLYKSLVAGEATPIETMPTILAGLDCGTVSSIAWPILKSGVDASGTVSDFETHEACKLLQSLGVSAGPCGAASLAALRRLTDSDKAKLGLDSSSTVVLFCTEGHKEYDNPRDVSLEDTLSLTQTLVQINSAVPGTGNVRGAGETHIARYIAAWFEHRDIETHWVEPTPGRPSVVGVVRGTAGSKSHKNLMFNGHIDTVTTAGYDGDPLSGLVKDGKLYGRGAADMKCGVAAIMMALATAKKEPLEGDVIFTAVADEEDLSMGTEQVLEAGWRADAAVVCEPTLTDLVIGHKGFVWFDVTIHGLAAHGSRFDLGVDAISQAGYFLVELDKYAKKLVEGAGHPSLGCGSVHASIVKGGEEPASYPAVCTVTIERRTDGGETLDQVKEEMESVLQAAAQNSPGLKYELKVTFARSAFEIRKDHPFVTLLAEEYKNVTGKEIKMRKEAFWTDCALIADKGMPVVMFGPWGEGLHAKTEWVEIESLEIVTDTLVRVMKSFSS